MLAGTILDNCERDLSYILFFWSFLFEDFILGLFEEITAGINDPELILPLLDKESKEAIDGFCNVMRGIPF